MPTSDSNAPPAGIHSAVEEKRKVRSASDLLIAMSQAISSSNAGVAKSLLQEADRDHQNDAALSSAVARCRSLVDRADWMDTALESASSAIEEDCFVAVASHFREALTLSQGLPLLRSAVTRQVELQSEKLLPQNWRVAQTLLREAADTEPSFTVPPKLSHQLESARRNELLTSLIHQADRLALEGKTEEAKRKLADLLVAHPDDVRIRERLDHASETVQPENSLQAPNEAEFTTPADPEPAIPEEAEDVIARPWMTKILIPKAAWDAAKNFAALAATTAMLGTAGFIVWRHFSTLPTNPVSKTNLRPMSAPASFDKPGTKAIAVLAHGLPPDEQAWNLVKTSDDHDAIRSFLNEYPSSPHVRRAKVRLAILEWQKINKSNAKDLETYLHSYPDTPYQSEAQRLLTEASATTPSSSKVSDAERDAILQAAQSYQEAQGQDSDANSVFEQPLVNGDRATLRYHTSDQTGSLDVTYSLVRQPGDGRWKVQSVR